MPTSLGYLREQRLLPHERRVRTDKLKAHKYIFALAATMAAAALGLAFVSLWGTDQAVLIYSLLSSAILSFAAFKVLPPMLARCNFYMFLVAAMYVQIDGALDYFYTSDETYVMAMDVREKMTEKENEVMLLFD